MLYRLVSECWPKKDLSIVLSLNEFRVSSYNVSRKFSSQGNIEEFIPPLHTSSPFFVADSPWCLTAAVDSVISSCRLFGLPCASVPAAYPTSHQVEVWQELDSMSTYQHARIMSKSHFHAQCGECVALTLEIVFPVMKVEVVNWWFLFHFSGVCWVFACPHPSTWARHWCWSTRYLDGSPASLCWVHGHGELGGPRDAMVPAGPCQFAWQSSEL